MEPVIKVRYKEKLFLFVCCWLLGTTVGFMPRCDKTPHDQTGNKIPGDQGFSIHVSGSPRKYRPNQVYTIQLSGVRDENVAKFQGFLLVAEPALGNTAIQSPTSLGTFQLMAGDAMTKFSHRCSHAVESSSAMIKSEITVYWTSPPRGSGCIDFKAMVVERQDVWYQDDGGLTYNMCEDDGPLSEPTVVQPCCACDEAKYEVIFEGIWSRHTHPKDFPVDEWRTMFSTLIGASHSENYTLWEYGRPANPSLQIFGEVGVTRRLESEMKRFSNTIRSVVKAHGLQQRSNVVGQTFAVFRVDRIHHLLSVVSKMIPSPDWIVGLSKENLCLPNCSWVDNRVIDLYPWDLGTDSGLRYDSPPTPQRPKGVIQRITSSDPPIGDSPFYDATGAPMKPAARLHLIKQREYFRNCPEGMQRPGMGGSSLNPSWNSPDMGMGGGMGGNGDTSYYYGTGIGQPLPDENYEDPYASTDNGYGGAQDDYDYSSLGGYNSQDYSSQDYNNVPDYNMPTADPCMTTDWGAWSECSATCDSGSIQPSQSRVKDYLDRETALLSGCDVELFEKRACTYLPKCRSYGGSFNPFEVDQMSGYSSPWVERGLESDSQLSYSYDGQQNVPRYSNNGVNGNFGPRQRRPTMNNAGYDQSPYGNSYTYGGNQMESIAEELPMSERLNAPMQDAPPNCEISQWGEWSDCSSKCDTGSKTRNRRYTYPERSSDCSLDLYEVQPCRGNEADCPPPREPNGTPTLLPPATNMGMGSYSYDGYEEEDPTCQTSDWSPWSPCSKKCGSGFQRRTRMYLIPFVPDRSCDVRLYDKQDCYGTASDCDNYGYFRDSYSSVDEYEKSTKHVIENNNEQEISRNMLELDNYDDTPIEDICSAEMDPGNCHSMYERWYYDSSARRCMTFKFTGCYGNKNNFATKEKCESMCLDSTVQEQQQQPVEEQPSQNYWSSMQGSRRNQYDSSLTANDFDQSYNQFQALNYMRETVPLEEQPQEEIPLRPQVPLDHGTEIDCHVSAWGTWTECSKSCGTGGWQTRHREVLINPSTYGKACPKKMMRRKKCRQMPCPSDTTYWYQGSWRHMVDPGDE